MSWLSQKIKALQNKPYPQRLRILRLIVGATVVAIIGLWLLSVRWRNGENAEVGSETFGKFIKIMQGIKEAEIPK